jgi:hypothetical protein
LNFGEIRRKKEREEERRGGKGKGSLQTESIIRG